MDQWTCFMIVEDGKNWDQLLLYLLFASKLHGVRSIEAPIREVNEGLPGPDPRDVRKSTVQAAVTHRAHRPNGAASAHLAHGKAAHAGCADRADEAV